jgi:hypothetical protein
MGHYHIDRRPHMSKIAAAVDRVRVRAMKNPPELIPLRVPLTGNSMPRCEARHSVCRHHIAARVYTYKLLDLGTDSYTEVVPAPLAGRVWGLEK